MLKLLFTCLISFTQLLNVGKQRLAAAKAKQVVVAEVVPHAQKRPHAHERIDDRKRDKKPLESQRATLVLILQFSKVNNLLNVKKKI